MICFSGDRAAKEWAGDGPVPLLRAVVADAASYLNKKFASDLNLTCVFRTVEEDKALYHDPEHEPGVHCFWRGADVSVRLLSSVEAMNLVAYLNYYWTYDPNRLEKKVALYETTQDFGSTAPHIHIQVHPDTRRTETT